MGAAERHPTGLGVGFEDVWVLAILAHNPRSSELMRLEDGAVTSRLRLSGRPGCVDFSVVSCNPVIGGGATWVPVGSRIYRVASGGREVQAAIDTHARIFDITYSAGSVWVLAGSDLLQIDPVDNKIHKLDLTTSIGAGLQPNHMTASGGDLWISCFGTDPTASVLAHVQAWRSPLSVAAIVHYPAAGTIRASGPSLWVSSGNGAYFHLQRLDTRTGLPAGPAIQLANIVTWIATGTNDLWLTTFRNSDNVRQLVRLKVPA